MFYHHAADRTASYNYAIRNIVAEAKKVEATGVTVSYLNIGDPPKYGFKPPEALLEAYLRAIKEQPSGYSPSAGILEARTAVSEKMNSRGIATNPDSIFITDGASEAADIVYSATLNEGEDVIVPSPGYPLYNALANKVGAKQVFYQQTPTDGWRIHPEEIIEKITPRSKVLVIVNPNNPTGSICDASTLAALLEIARKYNLIVISDEVYSEMVFDVPHTPVASLAGNDVPVFTLDSMSKNFLAPGWRLGWAVITNLSLVKEIRDAMLKLADARLCANTYGQYTIKTAMSMPKDYFANDLKRLREQRDITYTSLNSIEGIVCNKPQGAFYAFPKVDIQKLGFNSDEAFVLNLLKETGILVVHGSGFGMNPTDGFFRMTFLPDKPTLVNIFASLKSHVASLGKKAGAVV